MQEFEDFLATIHFPPNPFRNFFNDLPQDLPLSGHFFTGLGGQTGQPLPNGNASFGEENFADHHLILPAVASCTVCHTQPTGAGSGCDGR